MSQLRQFFPIQRIYQRDGLIKAGGFIAEPSLMILDQTSSSGSLEYNLKVSTHFETRTRASCAIWYLEGNPLIKC